MPIELDHTLVPSHHPVESARQFSQLLDVAWAASGAAPYSPVYVNAGLTLDFIGTDQPFPIDHFCFRVGEADFDAMLGRLQAAGID